MAFTFRTVSHLLGHLRPSPVPIEIDPRERPVSASRKGGVRLVRQPEFDFEFEAWMAESVQTRNPKRKPARIQIKAATYVNFGRSYPLPGRVLGEQEAARRLRQMQGRRLP